MGDGKSEVTSAEFDEMDQYAVVKSEAGTFAGKIGWCQAPGMPPMFGSSAQFMADFLAGRPVVLLDAFELRAAIDTSDKARGPARLPLLLPVDFVLQGAVLHVHPIAAYFVRDMRPADKALYRIYRDRYRQMAAEAKASASMPTAGGEGLPGIRLHDGR